MAEHNLGSNYVIGERLGSGAMGTVYRGRDHEGRAYAFKVLRSELAEEPELVRRFVQERSSLTVVDHPNVVAMHDLVVEGSTLAIVMDLVPGTDLRHLLRERGTLPPAEVARLGAGIAAGLAAVHRAGIVHRDIKPENVLLDTTVQPPTPRVTDFGIARIADASAATRSSMMVGTPHYMAPETADGGTPTPAVDVYGLGTILYELCCGVTPFEGGSYLAVIKRHAEARAGRPYGVPDDLWSAIEEMLAKDPAARPSAQQVVPLLTHLAQQLQGQGAAPALTAAPAAGAAVTERTARSETAAHAADVSPSPHRPRRRRSVVPVLLGLGLVAVVAAGAVWWTMLRGDDAPADAAETVAATGTVAPSPTTAEEPAAAEAATTAAPTDDTRAAAAPEARAEETAPEATTVPDVVGMTLSAARMELSGARVTVLEEIAEDAKDNEVLAQSVAPGQNLPGEVELTVARQPVTIYLSDVRDVGDANYYRSFGTGQAQISGEPYPRSMVDRGKNEAEGAWNLSRGFRELRATLGRSDTASDTETEVQVEIFLDRRKVHTEVVGFGAPVDLSVDLSDALRLQIVAKSLDGREMNIVLGDVRLLGLPGEVPELEE